jgi:hypothetical protein
MTSSLIETVTTWRANLQGRLPSAEDVESLFSAEA